MNNRSGNNTPRQNTQAEEELRREREEQEAVDQELRHSAERREKVWKGLFQFLSFVIPVIGITAGIFWKKMLDSLEYKRIYGDEPELYYEKHRESEEGSLVSADSESAGEEAKAETVTSASPATPAAKSSSTSHWPNYSYSDRHGYDGDDDDDDDDTWYRGDDDPDEYYEYDFHE